jgi:hypothetical protein
MLIVSRLSAGFVTPEYPTLGFTKVAVSMVIRLGVAVAALVAYYVWARPGLVLFGTALVAGFFLMVTVELFLVLRTARR